jgi:methyl-accepting chemotaxis protein
LKSLKTKLIIVILGIILVSNCLVAFIAYGVSKSEMTNAVYGEVDAVAKNVSSDIVSINKSQYTMLSTLAVLPVMKDPSASLEEKCRTARAVAEADASYVNIAYYDGRGMSYTDDGRLMDFSDRDYFKQAF